MRLDVLSGKVMEYYHQGGTAAVCKKINHVLRTRISIAFANAWWKLHRGQLPKDTKDAVRMWKIYIFLKNKYKNILLKGNGYLKNFQEDASKETPKIIWWCWLQGEDKAPSLCKAALASLRKNYPDYDVRVVTSENLHDYVHMPSFIDEKFKSGEMAAAHYSDVLRTLLLIEHGGVWIDSTVFSSKRAVDILNEPLFFYQTFMRENRAIICSSWMIVARPGHPVLLMTRDLLFSYWQTHNYTLHYFIYHFFFHMAAERYQELWDAVPLYSNIPVHVMQAELFKPYNPKRFEQITRMADFHKLTHHLNASTEGDVSGTNYEHIITMMGEYVD